MRKLIPKIIQGMGHGCVSGLEAHQAIAYPGFVALRVWELEDTFSLVHFSISVGNEGGPYCLMAANRSQA